MHSKHDEWFGRRHAVIATMHGKERVIGPLLHEAFGMSAEVCAGIDTDRFGTFTRDVRRPGTQRETARKKALLALQLSQADIAIASEGAFNPHPDVPFVCESAEVVLLLDRRHGLEIAGWHHSLDVHTRQEWAHSADEAISIAQEWDFPRHGIVVRATPDSARGMQKDIGSLDELARHARHLLRWPWRRKVFLETDMRAHRNPTRMLAIEKATKDLIQRMCRACVKCGTPGFGLAETRAGLPCRQCRMPTRNVRERISRCVRCGHNETATPRSDEFAEPGECRWCNP